MTNEILNRFEHARDIFADVMANDTDYADAVRNHSMVKENLKPLLKDSEEFRYIAGFPNYVVTNLGRVININTLKVLKPTKIDTSGAKRNSYNYYRYWVRLYNNAKHKNYYIHTLVAEAFLDKPAGNDLVVNHKNHDTSDNRAENLEWVTRSENSKDQLTNRWTEYSIDELLELRSKTIYGSNEYYQLNSIISYRRKKQIDGSENN